MLRSIILCGLLNCLKEMKVLAQRSQFKKEEHLFALIGVNLFLFPKWEPSPRLGVF